MLFFQVVGYAVRGTLLSKKLQVDICASEALLEETLHWNCHANSEKSEMMSLVWNICDEFDVPVPPKDFAKSTFRA